MIPITPKLNEVRKVMPEDRHEKSLLIGITISALSFAVWGGLLLAIGLTHLWGVKLLLAVSAGVVSAPCFVVAHDACHGTLVPQTWLNKIIGRIMFLPTLHPFSSWEYTHNGLHHVWTNVRGKEVAYVPFTKEEFDKLPTWRRLLERFFRSPFGVGAFYFFTVWIPYEMFPFGNRMPPGKRKWTFQWDRLLVLAFASSWVLLLGWLSYRSNTGVAATVFFGFIVELAVFHMTIGTVSFLHHSHPDVAWYDGVQEYDYFLTQVRSSIHLELPRFLEMFLYDVLQHTAHHADPRIPLYHLAGAQAKLKSAYAEDVTSEPWSVRGYLRVFRTCRLFDYQQHRWLDYDGTPLSEPLLSATNHADNQ